MKNNEKISLAITSKNVNITVMIETIEDVECYQNILKREFERRLKEKEKHEE